MFGEIEQMHDVIEPCLKYFGVDRCLFGSNHPVSYTNEYNYWHDQLCTLISNEKDQTKIFHQNTLDAYSN